jgi:hypothetical protein
MNDSKEKVEIGAETNQPMCLPFDTNTPGLTSLSEWAEFSSLIQKLDGEYAEALSETQGLKLKNSPPATT